MPRKVINKKGELGLLITVLSEGGVNKIVEERLTALRQQYESAQVQ